MGTGKFIWSVALDNRVLFHDISISEPQRLSPQHLPGFHSYRHCGEPPLSGVPEPLCGCGARGRGVRGRGDVAVKHLTRDVGLQGAGQWELTGDV